MIHDGLISFFPSFFLLFSGIVLAKLKYKVVLLFCFYFNYSLDCSLFLLNPLSDCFFFLSILSIGIWFYLIFTANLILIFYCYFLYAFLFQFHSSLFYFIFMLDLVLKFFVVSVFFFVPSLKLVFFFQFFFPLTLDWLGWLCNFFQSGDPSLMSMKS